VVKPTAYAVLLRRVICGDGWVGGGPEPFFSKIAVCEVMKGTPPDGFIDTVTAAIPITRI